MGHVARKGRIIRIAFWWEIQKYRNSWGDPDIDRRNILVLRWIVEKQDGAVWNIFIWLTRGISGGLF